jgi:hypothetical protein
LLAEVIERGLLLRFRKKRAGLTELKRRPEMSVLFSSVIDELVL